MDDEYDEVADAGEGWSQLRWAYKTAAKATAALDFGHLVERISTEEGMDESCAVTWTIGWGEEPGLWFEDWLPPTPEKVQRLKEQAVIATAADMAVCRRFEVSPPLDLWATVASDCLDELRIAEEDIEDGQAFLDQVHVDACKLVRDPDFWERTEDLATALLECQRGMCLAEVEDLRVGGIDFWREERRPLYDLELLDLEGEV